MCIYIVTDKMSANTHYWTIVFPTDLVLRTANEFRTVRPEGQRGGPVTQLRPEKSVVDNNISNVFKNYDTVVKPLIDGKYTSKRQLEIALRIIIKNLKPMYSDCFSTTHSDYPVMRSIIRRVGGVGVDVIKHIVTPDGQETTKNWESLESFFEIITFWNNPDPTYVPPPPDVQPLIDANKLTPNENTEIELLDKPSQLSSSQLAQICGERGDMSSSRQAQSAVWQWQSDDGATFNNFVSEYCDILEAAHKAKLTKIFIGDKNWLFDINKMTQTNPQTHSTRSIKRISSSKGGKRTRKYKCKNRNSSKYRVRLSKRYNN